MKNFRLLIPFYFLSSHAVSWVYAGKEEHEKLIRFNNVRTNSYYTVIIIIGVIVVLYNFC